VHGYETSGVQGAILFLNTVATDYAAKFNIVVVPCVSPWGYETIQRWNCNATDPNRSFNPEGEVVEGRSFNPEPSTDESRNLIAYLKTLGVGQWMCHIDQVRPISPSSF
jgi:predicted deacylase